jgi:hypothetical protein
MINLAPDLGEFLAEILNDICVQTMILHHGGEAVKPFKLHPTSMSYIYEVFEHLQRSG